MRIQLWSYNYDPEPTGIGPVSTCLARGLLARGHEVDVVAAHPHYPEPRWGTSRRPYREVRDGVPVLRLPLWIGRDTAAERYRQELSFMLAQTVATPMLGSPDVIVSASPSFPALLPATLRRRVTRTPWVLWLHDILPDGAAASGIVDESSPVIRVSRRLERAAYRAADSIVVLSRAFTDNLAAKGVPTDKIELIYDPATRTPATPPDRSAPPEETTILSMGNIGYSQGLAELIGAYEDADDLNRLVRIRITGNGMAADDVARTLRTGRVEMLGLVDDQTLEDELQSATIALVTQRYEGGEFNIPSKLMNFMAYGLLVLAAVNPAGEVARLIEDSGAGWVVDSSDPGQLPRAIAQITADPAAITARAAASAAYASAHFSTDAFLSHFEELLAATLAAARR